jgi:Fe-Mn family superoxide dismutase
LAQKIEETFGSFENFQSEFTQKALSVFGSGWAWLVVDNNKLLILTYTPGQDSPFFVGLKPIL